MTDSILPIESLRAPDSQPISTTSPDMLDFAAIKAHIEQAASINRLPPHLSDPMQYALDRRCLVETPYGLLATMAGLLCFGKTPQQTFSNAVSNLIHYRDRHVTALDVIHIERGIGGTIFDQIARIEEYFTRTIRRGMTVDQGFKRRTVDQYPLVVLRELTINMLAHRDYTDLNSVSQVRIFEDSIEWQNPGVLLDQISIDQLITYQRARNPTIFNILYDHGLIEGVGQGLDTVIAELSRSEMRKPDFVAVNTTFFLARVYGRSAFTVQTLPDLTKRQEQILAFVRVHGEVTSLDIIEGLEEHFQGLTHRTLLRDIDKLIQFDLLISKGRSRSIRYTINPNLFNS